MDGSILANRSTPDRNKTDFYPTPPDVTVALLDFLESRGLLRPRGTTIWEPACGSGEMVRAMIDRGYNVYYSDLYPVPADMKSVDFLATKTSPGSWIITNPPFSQADAFIQHALELQTPCAFLLKSQFWHAQKRLDNFRLYPPAYVLPLTWRPDFLWGAKSGSPTMEVLWTVWHGRPATTQYIPLERPGKK